MTIMVRLSYYQGDHNGMVVVLPRTVGDINGEVVVLPK